MDQFSINFFFEKYMSLKLSKNQFKTNFLAAMSSSRSDVVTQFVRVSVRPSPFFLLVSLKFLLVLKSFNGVSRQFKECLKFNGSFKAVSRKF